MSDKYNRIMSMLDPEVIAEKVSSKVWLARETFPLESNKVNSYTEFKDILARHINHHMRDVAGYPEEWAYTWSEVYLKKQGLSMRTVYDQCQRGVNGGLKYVLDKITEGIEREKIEGYISGVLKAEMDDPNDLDQIYELMAVFAKRNRKHLTPLQAKYPFLLVSKWREILFEAARIQSELRSHIGDIP